MKPLQAKVKDWLKEKNKNWLGNIFGQFINVAQIESPILSYKGASNIDVAAFYCPYVPLIVTHSNSVIDMGTGQSYTAGQILKVYYDKN